MVWGALGLFLAVYGFFSSGESFLIPVGIVFVLIGIRRTVFNYEKIGTLVNFVVLVIAVTLGTLVYLFDDDDKQQKKIVKADVPKVAPKVEPQKHTTTIAQPPTVKPLQTVKKERNHLEKKALPLKCAEQAHFDNRAVNRNGEGNISAKLCPDFETITIFVERRTSSESVSTGLYSLDKDQYLANWKALDFINLEILKDRVILSPKVNKFNGYILVDLKTGL